jgi:TatD DNase family protein
LSNQDLKNKSRGKKFIDTHFHPIDFIDHNNNIQKITLTANSICNLFIDKSIAKHICISTNIQDVDKHEREYAFIDGFYFSIGIHPCEVRGNIYEDEFFLKSKILTNSDFSKKIVSIGEVGLDFFHEKKEDCFKKQIEYFEMQINIAIENDLPLIIHSRNSIAETYDVLKKFKNKNIRGVIHCFSENFEWAKKFVDLNFFLGIGGIVTYPKNSFLIDSIRFVGVENILYETDSPWLPPQWVRGKINTPENIPKINFFLSENLSIYENILSEIVYSSSIKVFGL